MTDTEYYEVTVTFENEVINTHPNVKRYSSHITETLKQADIPHDMFAAVRLVKAMVIRDLAKSFDGWFGGYTVTEQNRYFLPLPLPDICSKHVQYNEEKKVGVLKFHAQGNLAMEFLLAHSDQHDIHINPEPFVISL